MFCRLWVEIYQRIKQQSTDIIFGTMQSCYYQAWLRLPREKWCRTFVQLNQYSALCNNLTK